MSSGGDALSCPAVIGQVLAPARKAHSCRSEKGVPTSRVPIGPLPNRGTLPGVRHEFQAIDAHAAGAPVRLLIGGVPRPSGATMAKRQAWFERRADHVRRATVLEPRGHRDLIGVLLTEPVSGSADAGLLFLDAEGYPPLKGAAVIAAATIALERGLITKAGQPGDSASGAARLEFETLAGTVTAVAQLEMTSGRRRVTSVRVTCLPSFVAYAGYGVVLGSRRLKVDLAFAGGFYAIVDSESSGIPLVADRLSDIRRLGVDLCAALDGHDALTHPDIPGRSALAGAILTGPPQASEAHLRSVTIAPHGGCDRSPGVTGTAAMMAVLHAMGLLPEGDEFVHEGLLGLVERGRVVSPARVGDLPAIIPEVTGTAWITGDQTLVVEDDDPLRDGFAVVDAGPGLDAEVLPNEAGEQVDERLSPKFERLRVWRPGQLVAAGHGRHPDLPHRSVGAHHELRWRRGFEDHLHHAILQFHFDVVFVGERHERSFERLERGICNKSKFRFAEWF